MNHLDTSNTIEDQLHGFFLNSVPKSGTHLLKQILLGLPDTFHIPGKVIYEGLAKDHVKHLEMMSSLEKNELVIGHIYYSKRWSNMLLNLNIKHVFIIRDVRDVVVSLAYFIQENLPTHPLYDMFNQNHMTQKERYLCLIKGVQSDEIQYGNIAQWFEVFHGWLTDPYTLVVTYEELMQSEESRRQSLNRIANYLWNGQIPPKLLTFIVENMEKNIKPTESPTFRKGVSGSWKDEFDEEVIEAFKEVAGELIIQLGYEKDLNW